MEIEILKKKLKRVCENIPQNQWRHFNKRTIENYINNWELIPGKIDKANTLVILSNCLDDVDLNFEPNAYYCISLYHKYLVHVKQLYRQLGFALVPGLRLFWGILILIIIIAFIIRRYFYLDIFFIGIVIITFLRMVIKLMQNKTYGIGY